MKNSRVLELKDIAKSIRRDIVKMHARSNASHIGSALSCVDILIVLFFKIMKIDLKNSKEKNRDRFILSKGHAVSALYAVLAKRGFFPKEALQGYCSNGGVLPGHSTKDCVKGVEVSTGSLGHGLPMSIGMAIANRYDKSKHKIFTLLGDGECDEGSVWEAALFASHHKLDNLVAIIDYNKLQAFGRINEVINLEPLIDKWIAFGWSVKEINGHNLQQIIEVFEGIPFVKNKPSMIVAHTIKGKGISFMENQLVWHYKSPNEEELKIALKELESL